MGIFFEHPVHVDIDTLKCTTLDVVAKRIILPILLLLFVCDYTPCIYGCDRWCKSVTSAQTGGLLDHKALNKNHKSSWWSVSQLV